MVEKCKVPFCEVLRTQQSCYTPSPHRAAEMSAKWRIRKSCYLNSSFIVGYKWEGFAGPA